MRHLPTTRLPVTRLLLVLAFTGALLAPLARPQPARAATPGNAFFDATWQRTDALVASTDVSRTWVWGPEPFTGAAGERYADSPGGTRLVQYFDKSRMEINDPNHDTGDLWFVTNGLLAKELITGQLQTGDDDFEYHGPALVNIAGDPDDPASPTYGSFLPHLGDAPHPAGSLITSTIGRDGSIGCCVPDARGVTAGEHVAETGHRVASVFRDYLGSSGPIVERGYRTRGALFANPYYATGYPIAEAYWAQVAVKGVRQWVLVQPFERRVLTWTPSNDPGWEVEMGNVGRHYATWRYGGGGPGGPPGWSLPAYPSFVPHGQDEAIPGHEARYELTIHEANVDSGSVVASERIAIEHVYGGLPDSLFLQVVPAQYGYFSLDGLWVNGIAVTPEQRRGGFILRVPLPAGTTTPMTIDLDFRLDVGGSPNDFIGTVLDQGILRLGYWFPIISNDHPYSETFDPSQSRSADFSVTLDVANDVVVAHTGWETGRDDLGGGVSRRYLAAEDVRDFALVLSREFSYAEVERAGVTLRYYGHPSSEGGLSDEALGYRQQVIFDAAADTISQLSALIGPYPYRTYSVVDVGPNMPGGLEFPGLIYINGAYAPLDRLIYHETAHQWMYAIIGNRTLVDGWIDEGGAEFFERGLPTGFSEVPQPPAAGYLYWLDSTSDELPLDSSRQWYYSIYEQGARFYYELLWMMGSDAFWDAFRDLYQREAGGIATPYEILSVFQSHSASDLRPIYDRYFRYPWVWQLLAPGG